MLSPNWDISTIQAYAAKLSRTWKRLSLVLHADTGEELTPRMIIDSFTEFEQVYEDFRDCVCAIEDSLALGHDPDREI
jgi:hypothetical protein